MKKSERWTYEHLGNNVYRKVYGNGNYSQVKYRFNRANRTMVQIN